MIQFLSFTIDARRLPCYILNACLALEGRNQNSFSVVMVSASEIQRSSHPNRVRSRTGVGT